MPNPQSDLLQCARCKSSDFVQQETYTVRTPVDVHKRGQSHVATAVDPLTSDRGPQTITDVRYREVVCARCDSVLSRTRLDDAVPERIALHPALEEELLKVHFYLWPELYPKSAQERHPRFTVGDELFEWPNDTVERVAESISDALIGHPTLRKELNR